MKRFIKGLSVVLILAILTTTLSGCEKKKKFTTESEMQNFVDGKWETGDNIINDIIIISNGKLVQCFDGWVDTWFRIHASSEDTGDLSFGDFIDKYYTSYEPVDIIYDYSNSQITYSSGDVFCTIMEDGTLYKNDDILEKSFYKSSGASTDDLINEQYEADEKIFLFNNDYYDLPTNRDVQYNKLSYLAQPFMLKGTAKLDDYYNWGYKNLSPLYFCMFVEPTGGSYSDSWYIYASRSDFSELYDDLITGSISNISLVCECMFYETGSNNMATLVDYRR